MPKPKNLVSLWDIKIPKESKQKLRKLAIKEKVEMELLLTAIIEKLYKEFYEKDKDLFKKGVLQ